MWERVLSDTRRPLLPFRTKSRVEGSPPGCLFGDNDPPYPDDDDEEHDRDMDAWLSKQDLKLPDAREKYTGDLDMMKIPSVSLKGTTIQCIIKLANIVLTPEKPEYPGGKWHVEGQWVITSTFFCYNCSLAFPRDGKRTHCFQLHICKTFTQLPPCGSMLILFSIMTAKTSLRHGWHSEDRRVRQNTMDKMTHTACGSSTISIGNTISRGHCLQNH